MEAFGDKDYQESNGKAKYSNFNQIGLDLNGS